LFAIVVKSSRKEDSIYGHWTVCVCHAHVNRLDGFRQRATSFVIVIRLFLLSRCPGHADWTRAAITHRRIRRMNASLCAKRREFDFVSITLLTIKEFSFNDSSASLLSIRLNRKSNRYINKAERNYRRRVNILSTFALPIDVAACRRIYLLPILISFYPHAISRR